MSYRVVMKGKYGNQGLNFLVYNVQCLEGRGCLLALLPSRRYDHLGMFCLKNLSEAF